MVNGNSEYVNHTAPMNIIATNVFKPQKNKSSSTYFFYFECTQEQDTHVPNYVVAEMVCEQCERAHVTGDSTCSSCGDRCPACDKWDRKGNKYVKEPCIGYL